MTTRAPARRRSVDTPALDRRIDEAESSTVVVWRGEEIPFRSVAERITRTSDRRERDALYAAYEDAFEALNPLYEERLTAWREHGDLVRWAAKRGTDPAALALDLERFSLNVETPYYAALRRYLALVDVEQGDGSEADVWHVTRGLSWSHWFGDREVSRALHAVGRTPGETADLDGWRGAESQLAGVPANGTAIDAVGAAYATLVGSPEWLADELGVTSDEVAAFSDFAAFVRLLRLRRAHAELQYELRLFAEDDPAIQRAYYSGMVGHMMGVAVGEAGYLGGITRPFASVNRLETALLGAMLVEVLERRHGARWWRDPASAELAERVGAAEKLGDALAELGYDALDWRPVLRQIRTRLIGEMSGYGGPNITTRAGTRKV
jgi:hypothetical protein